MITQLEKQFRAIGAKLGLTKFHSRRDGSVIEMYLCDRHALQMEIDQRENNLFLYAVRLRDGKLPGKNVVYRYNDGQQCRTYLEEVYRVKRTEPRVPRQRYRTEYLLECLEFYESLVSSAPNVLLEFLSGMDE